MSEIFFVNVLSGNGTIYLHVMIIFTVLRRDANAVYVDDQKLMRFSDMAPLKLRPYGAIQICLSLLLLLLLLLEVRERTVTKHRCSRMKLDM